jgi:hypothetical protein
MIMRVAQPSCPVERDSPKTVKTVAEEADVLTSFMVQVAYLDDRDGCVEAKDSKAFSQPPSPKPKSP